MINFILQFRIEFLTARKSQYGTLISKVMASPHSLKGLLEFRSGDALSKVYRRHRWASNLAR